MTALIILSLTLVAIGCVALFVSLFPTYFICKLEEKQEVGWKTLGALTVFFIIGYLFYAYLIITTPWTTATLIVSLILFGGGCFVLLVVRMSLRTIKSIKRLSALERHRALHDNLTDLPNRTLLYERIDYVIQESQKAKATFSILLLDIDRFKEINDALGHHYGDYLLQIMANRLCQNVRGYDTVSRLGGDDFAILLPETSRNDAVIICEKLLSAMEKPLQVEGSNLTLDISIGIAMFPEHGMESEAMMQHADIAMYNAKTTSTKYLFYSNEQDKYTLNRLTLISSLREAVEEEQFRLYYQPKISLKNKEIQGVEALLRWHHPDQEDPIRPDIFIELAEQTGLINQISLWVINQALRQAHEWHTIGIEIPISINLSVVNLHNLEFPAKVSDLFTKWAISPELITMEITESSMIVNPEKTHIVIKELRKLGVKLSIDDFGTGYSSLSYLKALPAHEIKIDKSFVEDMLKDENDAIIVQSTIELARNMGLNVIAEGVASREICDELHRLKCDLMQGYYFFRPLPPEELITKLSSSSWHYSGKK